MLAPDAEAPVVTETTVRTDLLQPLEIVTELRVDTVGENLRVLAVDNVPLPVQEPCGDLELRGVLDDGDDTLELIRVKLARAAYTLPSENNSRCRAFGDRTHRLLRSTSAFLQTRLA